MGVRAFRLLAVLCYALVAVGGAGVHLLEFAPHVDCGACHGAPVTSLVGECDHGTQPCSRPSHSHHNHPVHPHEDGCVTCSALGCQSADAPQQRLAEHIDVPVVTPLDAPLLSAEPRALPTLRGPPQA